MLLKVCISNTLLNDVTYNDSKIHDFLGELHVFDQEFHELGHVDGRPEVKNAKMLKLSSLVHRRLNALTANLDLLVLNILVFAVILIFVILWFLGLLLLIFGFFLLTFSFAG